MNPAAHRRLGATVHVKTNLTFDLRRSDAFYFRGTSFALSYSHFRLAVGLLADVLGLVACLHANNIGLGLKGLFACLGDDRSFFLDLYVCGFRHLCASTVSYGTVTYVTVTHGYVNIAFPAICVVSCKTSGVMRMMERMADFSHILTTRPDFDDEDREWLHHLVADWQVIADLSFADLLLILQNGEGKYIIAEQCRPSTVMSLRADDVVGDVVEEEMSAELDAAMASESVFRSTVLRTVGESTVCNVYAPVRHNGKTLGLVVRETNMATRESNGRYESESISAGKQLYEMIPRGQFPYRNPIMNQRHNARVADGFIVLTVEGIVRYASPNAISCFRRLGSVSTMQGEYLSEIGTKLLRENDPVLETLPLVLSGKAAVDSELDANKSAVSMRSLPLMDANGRVGAVVLCRDVTELRRREKELQTKDATISEIHHRVKNNLQAVSALLRLQARKTKSEEVKKELKEAQRRVQTIAMVHEGLSQTADEIVDYDKVISSLLKMAVDLATMRDQHIDIDFIGRFGMMPAQDATPLSLVLTELITNSVEHGFEGRKEGHITISVGRGGNNLNVVVEDDGTGLANEEHDGMARSSGSGLGTQIISTFVNNDFGGTVRWEPRRGGGTRVVLDMKLRAAQER